MEHRFYTREENFKRTLCAVAWLEAYKNGTQQQASKIYGIPQSSISTGLSRIRALFSAYDRIDKVAARNAVEWKWAARGRSLKDAAKRFDLPIVAVTLANKVRRFELAKAAALRQELPTILSRVERERENCAKIAEAVGGEYGAYVAAAIRAQP